MRWLTLFFCLFVAPLAWADDLEELPEDEALRLISVTPSDENASPEGASIQWEASRGQLRLYILNRGEQDLSLDWTRSQVTNAAGTFRLAPSGDPSLQRSAIGVGTSFQDALVLIDGPPTVYGLDDIDHMIALRVVLGPHGAPTVYQHSHLVSIDHDQVERAAWRQTRYDIELLRGRTVRRTVGGAIIGAAGVFLLANPNLSEANGQFDEQKHILRVSTGAMTLTYGAALTLVSSVRRGRYNDDLAAHDALAP